MNQWKGLFQHPVKGTSADRIHHRRLIFRASFTWGQQMGPSFLCNEDACGGTFAAYIRTQCASVIVGFIVQQSRHKRSNSNRFLCENKLQVARQQEQQHMINKRSSTEQTIEFNNCWCSMWTMENTALQALQVVLAGMTHKCNGLSERRTVHSYIHRVMYSLVSIH